MSRQPGMGDYLNDRILRTINQKMKVQEQAVLADNERLKLGARSFLRPVVPEFDDCVYDLTIRNIYQDQIGLRGYAVPWIKE